jgi:hypothetical protein
VAATILLVVTLLFMNSRQLVAQTTDSWPQNARVSVASGYSTRTLVVGFVGGFVHSDDSRHSEVQLARHVKETYADHVQVLVYKNRERERARKAITKWLTGVRGNSDQVEPCIILFGHSWGASAVVYLARELERDGVPVALTIQVDSVRKHGEDDSVIPANVADAINFYQNRGMIHGRSMIVAADPSFTTILGNLRFEYQKEPLACRAYPWYDRVFFKGHTSIECDPQVWSQVEKLIEARVSATAKPAQAEAVAQIGN